MRLYRSLWVAAFLMLVGALVVVSTMTGGRSSRDLAISFVGYTNCTFGKAAVFSAKNRGRFPLEWWYISTQLEGANNDMPPIYVSPPPATLIASRLKPGEATLVTIGVPPGTNRWRAQFQYAPSTLRERLLRLAALQHAPRPLLNPFWPSKLMTNSIWLMPKPAT